MALLAFDLKAMDGVLELLSPRERHLVAESVNEAILETFGLEKDPKLIKLLQVMEWSEEKLREKISFPSLKSFCDISISAVIESSQAPDQ